MESPTTIRFPMARMKKEEVMHNDFAEWYRMAGIEPDGDLLPKRWAAIEEFNLTARE